MGKIKEFVARQRVAFATVCALLTVASVTGFAGAASAAAGDADYDLAPVTTKIVSQVQESLDVILPIAGGLLALMVGWRLIKRATKA